jgi:dTDP-glucose pyrophosphorylase
VTPALVVLAAGMSTRYGRPKQFEPVGPAGEALLDYDVFDALRAGFGRVILVIRPELESRIRSHVAARWAGMDVRFVFQESEAGRRRPWGTAHAVLAAGGVMDGPFAVCNADDFYGEEAFATLGAHLAPEPEPEPDSALVAYRLGDTLSPHGGVSRAVCETDGSGSLTAVTELRDVRAAGDAARGVDPAGRTRVVPLDAAVSMNLWGFPPAVVPLLEEGFARFAARHRPDPDVEYRLSTAVHDLVTAGRMRLRVLHTKEAWMGITHPGDRDQVAATLRRLVDERRYPSPLAPPPSGAGGRA